MRYGFCSFKLTVSTFPSGSPLASKQEIPVTPCGLSIVTAGLPANGNPLSSIVMLCLSSINFVPVSVTVSINPTVQ